MVMDPADIFTVDYSTTRFPNPFDLLEVGNGFRFGASGFFDVSNTVMQVDSDFIQYD